MWDIVAEVGLFKLRGHKSQITGLSFIKLEIGSEELFEDDGQPLISRDEESKLGRFLLTTSKDALIKLWDIETRHCIETHVAQNNGECWSLGVSPDGAGCVTGGNDGELNIWSINLLRLLQYSKNFDISPDNRFLRSRGVLVCHGRERTRGISFHPRFNYFAVHGGSNKSVELWRMRSEEEVKRSLARKRRRKKEKKSSDGRDEQANLNADEIVQNEELDNLSKADVNDYFTPYVIVRTTGKVSSVDWIQKKGSHAMEMLVATTNNQLEVYKIPTKQDSGAQNNSLSDYSRTLSVELSGHRADIRALSLSSDDKILASASNGCLKVWNIKTGNCIRTFECGYALCCAFLPGDKILAVGTKSGDLELFDVVSATMIERKKAHDGAIWTMHVHPDGQSLVSGSADKTAKFWNFKVTKEEIPGTKRMTSRLSLVQSRILKVSDDILSLRFSPDSQLIAIALLDNTVKVFYVDSLKLFLNLYGHKLPVLSLDISFDSKLIVTSSADKNIRLWGLGFGDCHRAFFAHQDSVLQVSFVRNNQDGNGHHFFSASKDKVIKYWDGDKFEQIQKLENHHGEIWAMTSSNSGNFLVSASHDKSIRTWVQTDEQIFLEEEKEKELENLYESTLTASLETAQESNDMDFGTVSKQTISTLTAGEKISEALEIGISDLELVREWESTKARNQNIAPPSRNILFTALGGISAEEHVLSVFQKIRAAELEDALLILPFSSVLNLFKFLDIFAAKSMNIQLTCRILLSVLQIHHRQIVTSKAIKSSLQKIRKNLRYLLDLKRSEIGFNIAALKIISTQCNEREVRNYVDETSFGEDTESRKKRGFLSVS